MYYNNVDIEYEKLFYKTVKISVYDNREIKIRHNGIRI